MDLVLARSTDEEGRPLRPCGRQVVDGAPVELLGDVPAQLLAGARRVVVLENVVDPTNVGAIFRSVGAIGADAVLVTPRCSDPFYRRAIRVSMGTVLQVPWTRTGDWTETRALLHDAGFTIAAVMAAGFALVPVVIYFGGRP